MKKKLTTVGNSLALIIERPILDILGIDKDTELEVRTDGEGLLIKPLKKSRKERVADSAERMMNIHKKTLRKLAK